VSGVLLTLLTASAASSGAAARGGFDHSRSTTRIALLAPGAGCPVPVAGSQHVSAGDIAVSTTRATAKNGVLVTPGQTVFYAGPSPKGVDSGSSKPKTSSAPVLTPAAGNVVSHPSTTPHPTTAASKTRRVWTVQVASYETIDQAQTLEEALCQRGYNARIVGTSKPFSVQVGAYPSSDSAMVIARHLSSRELTVFVTLAKY
jgi:cell division septation protein DedD